MNQATIGTSTVRCSDESLRAAPEDRRRSGTAVESWWFDASEVYCPVAST
jgi:hypothetical protein